MLGLAAESCLSASAAFGASPRGGKALDRDRRVRRVNSAWLDHVPLVMQPAYSGAEIIAVRSTGCRDALAFDPVFVRAAMWCDPVFAWARSRTSKPTWRRRTTLP